MHNQTQKRILKLVRHIDMIQFQSLETFSLPVIRSTVAHLFHIYLFVYEQTRSP